LQPGVFTAQTFPQELSHYFLLSSPRYDSLFINLITVIILSWSRGWLVSVWIKKRRFRQTEKTFHWMMRSLSWPKLTNSVPAHISFHLAGQ